MENIRIPWPDWKAVRRIGNGSYGSVYEIEREDEFGHTEKAALKVISIPKEEDEIEYLIATGYDNKSITEYYRAGLKSIIDEYAIMARLKGHPNIVGCEDRRALRQENGVGWDVYIRMELLKPFLKDLNVKEKTEQDIIKLGKDLLNALTACHELNIIHRDIKPENIFVTRYGDYKLGDFGVARIMSHTTNATKTGTPYYMAPEVCKEEKYGKEADIYSLGMVLFWLLNNTRMPFEPDDRLPLGVEKERAYKERLSGKEIPEPLNGSPELKKVIKKALAYDPKDRYRSAEEMLNDLSHVEQLQIVQSEKQSQSKNGESMQTNTVADDQNEKSVDSNKPDVIESSTQPEETIDGNSWESGEGTIGITPGIRNNQHSENMNESEDKTDIDQTGEYESPTVSEASNPQSHVSGHEELSKDVHLGDGTNEESNNPEKPSAISPNESGKTYRTEQNSREQQIDKNNPNPVQNKKPDTWKKYLLYCLIPFIIGAVFLISNRNTELSKGNEASVESSDSVQSTVVPLDKKSVVSSGDLFTIALKSDGTVVATGETYEIDGLVGWKDIVAITAGMAHAVGLKSDGTVVAIGWNEYGQCNVADWKDIVSISANSAFTVGLRSDGTVVATGENSFGQCDVAYWKDIVAISAAHGYTVGLKSDGTVITTRDNEGFGINGDIAGWKDIVAVSSGTLHTVGVKSDGTVVATGDNDEGQCDVTDWKDIIAVSAKNDLTVGLKSNGTVLVTGNDGGFGIADATADWKDIVAVAAGELSVVGLKSDGTVVATGANWYGQCDVSSWEGIKLPDYSR